MLNIELPVLNKEATKENVLKAIKKYRLFMKCNYLNETILSKENAKEERINYIIAMNKGLEKLDIESDRIIIQKYLLKNRVNRYEVMKELNLSEGDYYRKRNTAFYNYAYALGIEVEEC
ncbi:MULTISPECIES: ArpU family transcriptional regulator [Bacillus cereus group]|uniref:ArpU family transcriptional regulator n=1 Tax=Bacillus thuringiensis serovar kumamotoensis TaxID=132267 RepID=A0A9X6JQA8_BACUK|nr:MULTISPECIES: ArpU family transcriptional regulator [Bacillus cereus group]MCM3201654.1 ArpU family transcriptional regulator [Bacillus cereus]MCU4981228.1 ArpU family transcriptional regulator [Bacillus cereus]MCU5667295.1 ArpU family transcriptional regulator [Bacillus cereus]MDA2212313.1 ArpU family transcriptional regulator [Bacillus cereus]MDA2223893.1 ArpU family transcriptional regulator [Bacillus cereus]